MLRQNLLLANFQGNTSMVASLEKQLEEIKALVNKQAEDEGLWGKAEYASEAYIQSELRNLHICIEGGLNNKLLNNKE